MFTTAGPRIALGLTFLLSSVALGGSVTLAPVKDNTLYEDAAGSLSNGAGARVFAGTNGSTSIRRALLAFDVAGSIPAGSTITDARLGLNLVMTTAGPQTVSLHKASASWGESTSDAPGGEGGGAPAAGGDATWLHTFFATDFWVNAGGDFDPTPSSGTAVDQNGSYEWTSPQMVADVQSWLDAPAANFGWLVAGNEADSGTAKGFASRENPPEMQPSLTVDFEPGDVVVPAVSGWRTLLMALLALGAATWTLRRRRGPRLRPSS